MGIISFVGSLINYSLIFLGILWLIRYYFKRSWGSIDKTNEISAKGKIVVITGASAGIGKAAALEFAYRNANVILACRDLSKAVDTINWIRTKTTLGQLICMKLDLASLESVRKFCNDFKSRYDRLDILVNNAGVYYLPEENMKTKDGFEIHMGVNHLGHFLLTNLLLEQLKKAAPSRIVNVSSLAHSWASFDVKDMMSEKQDIHPKSALSPGPLYCRSKMANALFTKELARRLQGTGVRTYALCPGYVATDIGKQSMKGLVIKLMMPLMLIFRYLCKTSEEGAQTIMYCALSKNLINETGEMYQNCGYWDPKDRAVQKDENAKVLWAESAKASFKYLVIKITAHFGPTHPFVNTLG